MVWCGVALVSRVHSACTRIVWVVCWRSKVECVQWNGNAVGLVWGGEIFSDFVFFLGGDRGEIGGVRLYL